MFELQVTSNTPLSSVDDVDVIAETFLIQIGYIPKGYDPKTSAVSLRDSVPYRLFMDYLMRNMNKAWTVEDAIIAAVRAERDGALAIICAPIVAPTVEKIVSIPVSTVVPTNSIMRAVERVKNDLY